MSRVNVFLKAGAILKVDVPEGVEVHVIDYDVQGLTDVDFFLGQECSISVYRHELSVLEAKDAVIKASEDLYLTRSGTADARAAEERVKHAIRDLAAARRRMI